MKQTLQKDEDKIILFTQQSCIRCSTVKEMLEDRYLEFETADIGAVEGLALWAELCSGVMSTPILYWKGLIYIGLRDSLRKIYEEDERRIEDGNNK